MADSQSAVEFAEQVEDTTLTFADSLNETQLAKMLDTTSSAEGLDKIEVDYLGDTVETPDNTVEITELVEDTTLTFTDSLNETQLATMLDTTTAEGLDKIKVEYLGDTLETQDNNIGGEGLDEIIVPYRESLSSSDLDELNNGSVAGSRSANTDGNLAIENSLVLDRTVFGDETLYSQTNSTLVSDSELQASNVTSSAVVPSAAIKVIGKMLIATSEDVQKAKIIIANYLVENEGWNKFRLECEEVVRTDNLNTLTDLKLGMAAFQKVFMLYRERMREENLLVRHMLGHIKRFTEPSTSLYLEKYNRAVTEFNKRLDEFKRLRRMLDTDIRDPRLPAHMEFVNLPEEEMQKWIASFQNKLFCIRELLTPNDTYSYERLEFVMNFNQIPHGKIVGTVSFANFKYLCCIKSLWQHHELAAELQKKREIFEKWICEMPKPEELNDISDFAMYYQLEFFNAEIHFMNQICAPYLQGFGSGLYDETTDFEEIVRRERVN